LAVEAAESAGGLAQSKTLPRDPKVLGPGMMIFTGTLNVEHRTSNFEPNPAGLAEI